MDNQSGWQTSKTAPRDGRQFLAVRAINDAPGYSMSVAAYAADDGAPWLANMTWFPEGDFQRIWTHWCELPAPPTRLQ